MLQVERHLPAVLASVRCIVERGFDAAAVPAPFVDRLSSSLLEQPALAAAVWRDAALRRRVAELLDAAAADERTYVVVFGAVHMLTAQTKLRLWCGRFWAELERRGVAAVAAANGWHSPRFVATAAHRLAMLLTAGRAAAAPPPPSAELWRQLLDAAAARAPQMEARQVSNLLWGVAKVAERYPSRAAAAAHRRGALVAAAAGRAGAMSPQDVATSLWAAAKLGAAPAPAPLLAAAARLGGRMNCQDVSNTLWALAKLKAPLDGPLRAAMLAALSQLVDQQLPRQVSVCLAALAGLDVLLPLDLSDRLLDAVVRVSPDLTPQGAAVTLRALTRLEVSPPPAELLAAAERTAAAMNAQEVCMCLLALARLRGGVGHGPAAAALQRALARQRRPLAAQDVANGVFALAGLDLAGLEVHEDLRKVLLPRLEAAAPRLPPPGCRMLLRGLEVLEWPVSAPVRARLLQGADDAAAAAARRARSADDGSVAAALVQAADEAARRSPLVRGAAAAAAPAARLLVEHAADDAAPAVNTQLAVGAGDGAAPAALAPLAVGAGDGAAPATCLLYTSPSPRD